MSDSSGGTALQRVSSPRPAGAAAHGRVPPQAQDVEQSVLGAMLLEQQAISKAIEILVPDAFYGARHQRIYDAILSLFERGNPVDLITLTEELKRREILDDIGGPYYLSELTTRVATAANVEYHARIISEKYILRKMIETMSVIVGQAFEPDADAFDLLDAAEQQIFQISESQLRRSARSMSEVLKETVERLERIHGREGGITGVPSGFSRLDQMTSGWQPSDLVVVAARPSMGKTALALSLARNAALHPTTPTGVAIFSLEMSAGQLAQRLLTSEARVDAQAARTGRMSEQDWPRLARAAGRLSDAPIFVDDTPGLGILELRAKCRRLKAEHDIGLVMVDYLQLMHGSKDLNNREQEIAQISRSLKSLAKELNVPVIALSQLSRAVETRGGDRRPQLSDLRESGCLTGDTLITMADSGERIPMRELAGRDGFFVWALNQTTLEIEKAYVSRAFSTGEKQTYRLSTRLGRAIRATANHQFLTIHGWRRLDELSPGDRIALPRMIPGSAVQSISDAEVKERGLAEILRYIRERVPNTNRDVIPHHIWKDTLIPKMREKGITHRALHESREMSYSGMTVFGQNVSRDRALRVASVVESEQLERLARSHVYWDQITAIEPDAVEEVFDLTVPGLHNFVANDILVHNSIEQDADVVAFIYRAERYGIMTDEQGNSTAGIAEIIIGKQRNGPIGTIELAFVNQYARFETLTTHYSTPELGSGSGSGDGYDLPPGGDEPESDAPF